MVASRLLSQVKDDGVRDRYRRQLRRIVQHRPWEPHILFIYAVKVAMHYHFSALAHAMAQRDAKTGAMPDAGRSFSRAKTKVAEEAFV